MSQDARKYKTGFEPDRVFIAAHGDMQVDVHIAEDGISIQITRGNEVLAECSADAEVKS